MKLQVLIGFLFFWGTYTLKAQCNANFIDSSLVCGVYNFTNTSTGTTSTTTYSWTFQGGSPSASSLQSPSSITYTANGTYTACLTITNFSPFCTSNICQTLNISCFTSTNCTANFNYTSCIPSGPNAQMMFFNTSAGTNTTTVYNWNFGNSTSSALQNPTATYTANGVYAVCMSYTTFAPAYCTASVCQNVTVNCASTTTCAASFFSVLCTPSGSNAQVSFSNTSTGTNSTTIYNWSFGNNTTSTSFNGITTYTANGNYTVCLSIISASSSCTDTICNVITVTCVPIPSPTCQANFTNTPCNNGQTTFYSISTGTLTNTTYTWTNSGPPTSTSPIYTVAVCLKMTNHHTITPVNTCTSTMCKTVTVNCTEIGFQEFMMEYGKIGIFPNPSDGLFTLDVDRINLNSTHAEIKVYNVLGKLVHESSKEVNQGEINAQIDLQNLPNGAYYLRLSSGASTYSVKLVITR